MEGDTKEEAVTSFLWEHVDRSLLCQLVRQLPRFNERPYIEDERGLEDAIAAFQPLARIAERLAHWQLLLGSDATACGGGGIDGVGSGGGGGGESCWPDAAAWRRLLPSDRSAQEEPHAPLGAAVCGAQGAARGGARGQLR